MDIGVSGTEFPPGRQEDVVLKPKRASIVDAGDDHKIHATRSKGFRI